MDCNFGHILLVKRAANRLAFLLERVLTGTTDCECPSGEGRPIFNISGRLDGFCRLPIALPAVLAAAGALVSVTVNVVGRDS